MAMLQDLQRCLLQSFLLYLRRLIASRTELALINLRILIEGFKKIKNIIFSMLVNLIKEVGNYDLNLLDKSIKFLKRRY